jgi:hypothetical protein
MIGAIVFGIGFAVALPMAWRSGSPVLMRTGWAMLANFVAVWVITTATGNASPWLAFLVLDAVTARVVLAHPAARAQCFIGCIYVAQIIMHFAFGVADSKEHQIDYLNVLAFGGVCQLLILMMGAYKHGRGRKVASLRGGGGNSCVVAAPDLSRMDERQ